MAKATSKKKPAEKKPATENKCPAGYADHTDAEQAKGVPAGHAAAEDAETNPETPAGYA